MRRFLIVFALSSTGLLLWGFTVQQLWGWFIVPLTGLPTLALAHGVGLAITTQALSGAAALGVTVHEIKEAVGVRHEPLEVVLGSVTSSVMLLGMGWVAHLFLS